MRRGQGSSVRLWPWGRWEGSPLAPEVAELWHCVAPPPPSRGPGLLLPRPLAPSAAQTPPCCSYPRNPSSLRTNLITSASRSNCILCLVWPDFVSVYIILCDNETIENKMFYCFCSTTDLSLFPSLAGDRNTFEAFPHSHCTRHRH